MDFFILFSESHKYSNMASEVEETLKRLVSHKGVIGCIVVNSKSTLDNATTEQAKTMFNARSSTLPMISASSEFESR